MNKEIEYDAIIIGFGKGGKTLAVELAERGQEVAMIERSDKMYGGTCINIGCIPTKTLVHQAALATQQLNKTFEEKKEFYRHSIQIKDDVITLLRQKNYHNLADHPHITVYTGEGFFVSPEEVAVTTPQKTFYLKGKQIFINTGAETIIPPIPGIEGNSDIYTSTSMLELKELPRKLVIIGGGYIGLEYASIYASFGSQVTVLEGHSGLIPREDRDVAENVIEVLEKKGIVFRLNANVLSIKKQENKNTISCRDTETGDSYLLEADAILLATGRKPNTTGLHLEAAGVETDERGTIKTDSHLRTTVSHIYAIGDVKGGLQFTYISLDDYRILRNDLFGNGKRSTQDREPVSYSVFIDPPLAHIGLQETEARAQGRDIRIKKIPAAAIPRARTLGQTDGLLKAIIDPQSNEIIGCTLFCAEAGEIINTVAMAMKTGQKASFLRDFIFTHPSMSEAFNDLFA